MRTILSITPYKTHLISLGLVLLLFAGCKKQDDFLNAKPSQALSTIQTLSDCQLLLQKESLFNTRDAALGEISTDDYYVTKSSFNNLSPTEQNTYIWAQQIYPPGSDNPDWTYEYQQVYYANTVLDALPKITYASSQQNLFNQVKGTALFFRSIAFYNLVQTFALQYDSSSASTGLGIPLRLSSNINQPSTRASIQTCYTQILSDLQTALSLLPATTNIPTQPNQISVNGLLARIYLSIGDYSKALQYSNTCLTQNSQLVDYNTITPTSYSLITGKVFLSEDIYHVYLEPYDAVSTVYVSIADSTLYNSYSSTDLRKNLFWLIQGGVPLFRGSYDYQGYTFSGIATDEMYLIRAECNARMGNTGPAMNDVNLLLKNRYKTGTFVTAVAGSPDDALRQILTERRKELVFRGLRWTDLRRLNKDTRFAVTLTRVVNGVTYTLPPNDPRYAMPIPDDEIASSGIQQNNR